MIKARAILRRRWPILLIALALGVGAGYLSTGVSSSEKATSFKVEQVLAANRNGNVSVVQDALRLTRGPVLKRAAEIVGWKGKAGDLAALVTVVPNTDSQSLSVSVTSGDVAEATKVVDAFVTAFLENLSAQRQVVVDRLNALRAAANEADARFESFKSQNPDLEGLESSQDPGIAPRLSQRDRLETEAAEARAALDTASSASNAAEPYTTLGTSEPEQAASNLLDVPSSVAVRSGFLGVIGLMLGVVLVLVVERSFRRIDTREELAEAVDLPILAEIGWLPKKRRPKHSDGRIRLEGVWAEPYRRVRSALQFIENAEPVTGPQGSPSRPSAVFLVTSAQPSEGKSTSAALIALALAEVSIPTVAIGADFRRPEIDRLLGASGTYTLQDRARLDVNRPTIDDVVQPTAVDDLWIVPSGPSTREVVRLSQTAAEVMAEAARRGATVVVDTSPLQATNDTVDLLPYVDHIILVVRSGRSTAAGLVDSVELVRRHHGSVMGVILVGTPGVGRLQTYYNTYYRAPEDQTVPASGT